MKAIKKIKDEKMSYTFTYKMYERLQKTIKKLDTSPVKMDEHQFQEIKKIAENENIDQQAMSVLFEEIYHFIHHALEVHNVSSARKTKVIEIKNSCIYALSLLKMNN